MTAMTAMCKLYKHLLIVVNGFSKFVWLYPPKQRMPKKSFRQYLEIRNASSAIEV